MKKKFDTEVKVGLFIAVGLVLTGAGVLSLGSNESLFASKNHYSTHFASVDGLIVGAKSILGGVPVGVVETIALDEKTRDVKVTFSVEKKAVNWVRKDSTVEIATQGVLGDKFLSVHMGTEAEQPLPDESEIPPHASKDIAQFLGKGDQLLVTLNKIASHMDTILESFTHDGRSDNLFKGLSNSATRFSKITEKLEREMDGIRIKQATVNLNQILEKVNNGTGTIGSLINDSGVYDEVKALLGGANRNRIIRNLIRQTIKKSEEGQEQEQKK